MAEYFEARGKGIHNKYVVLWGQTLFLPVSNRRFTIADNKNKSLSRFSTGAASRTPTCVLLRWEKEVPIQQVEKDWGPVRINQSEQARKRDSSGHPSPYSL